MSTVVPPNSGTIQAGLVQKRVLIGNETQFLPRDDTWDEAQCWFEKLSFPLTVDVWQTSRDADCLARLDGEESKEGAVTIIVPCHNAERFIRRTLQSIAVQELESEAVVMVIDDGSKDESVLCVRNFFQEHGDKIRGRLFSLPRIGRVAAIRNFGLFHAARSEFVAFMDRDDLYASPHSLGVLLAALERDKSAIAAVGGCDTVDEAGAIISGPHMFVERGGRYRWRQEYVLNWRNVMQKNFSPLVQNIIVRRDHCPWFPYLERSEDVGFYARLFALSADRTNGTLDQIVQVEHIVSHYRIVATSASHTVLSGNRSENLDAYARAIVFFLRTIGDSAAPKEYITPSWRSRYASRYWIGRLVREAQTGRVYGALALIHRANKDPCVTRTLLICELIRKLVEDRRLFPMMLVNLGNIWRKGVGKLFHGVGF